MIVNQPTDLNFVIVENATLDALTETISSVTSSKEDSVSVS